MASSEPFPIHSLLMNVLDDLEDYNFQRFKVHLMNKSLLKEFRTIKRNKLETEDRTKILTVMLDTYGIFAITVTKRILKELQLNQTLKELNDFPYKPEEIIADYQGKLKSKLKAQFQIMVERLTEAGDEEPFDDRYTELYVTLADSGQVNTDHEVRQIERVSRKPAQETMVQCQDIFKGQTRRGDPIRAVLTKGVAGIGKTVLTQKLSLDWAEGRVNQDVQLLFLFTFRELNVLRDTEFSLVSLLEHFFGESAVLCSCEHLQVVFIFDGLDECRLPLNFTRTRVLTEITAFASVHDLLVNLIRRTLLPSARLWITTRPAAANQIPTDYISMVTEIRGFTDLQKEHYFRNRFRDEQEATAVISHIRTSRSLHIMCHLPIFCWILSTVIENIMGGSAQTLPKTLTNLYIHFMVVQIKKKNIKYDGVSALEPVWSTENQKMVKSLGKLAYEQLQKGNLIFYESDLRESGLDTAATALYSGVFTQVFREEQGLYREKVYCFIHLTVQEFLAALHVHLTFFISGVNLLSAQQPSEAAFYSSAVDLALQSPNGHLDLFLRFLLGLTLPDNQILFKALLTQPSSNDQTNEETVSYITSKITWELPGERTMNLLYCLNELRDHSLIKRIQRLMGDLRSPGEWSALAFLLQSSDSDLEQFDLKKHYPSEEAFQGLLPVVKASTKVILSCCYLSQSCCRSLSSVLKSSSMTHLDLSNNDLRNSGIQLLCSGLESATCRLETLRLSGCLVSEWGGTSLASALKSPTSHLKELDLSYNHLGSSAELLIAKLVDPQCPLDSLRLDPSGQQWMIPGLRKYSCEFSLDPNTAHRSLHLSEDKRGVTRGTEDQPCSDHPDRFSDQPQVLSSTGLTGRCYWEVSWTGKVDIALSYKRGQRDGCRFGENDQSWSLRINGESQSVFHNKEETRIQLPLVFGRKVLHETVRVLLDFEAGSLTFYNTSVDNRFALHTFTATFTEPLFPGFRLAPGSRVTVLNSRQNQPGC